MKITINEKACIKHKMTFEEFLLALSIRSVTDIKKTFDNLVNREVLVIKDGKYYVTQHWSDVLDEILADSGSVQDEDRLKNLASQMRDIYPQGRMIDRKTGQPTTFYFRSNVSEITQKLKTFFFRYGNYSDEDILDAERRYIASWNGNYQQPGFRQLKYFIWKDDTRQGINGNHVESISPLLDFLENKESEEEGVVTNADWARYARN